MMLVQHLSELLCIGNIELFAEDNFQYCKILMKFLVQRHMITFLSMALDLMVNFLMAVLWPAVRYFPSTSVPYVCLHASLSNLRYCSYVCQDCSFNLIIIFFFWCCRSMCIVKS